MLSKPSLPKQALLGVIDDEPELVQITAKLSVPAAWAIERRIAFLYARVAK